MKIKKIEKKKRLYLIELDSDDKLYVTEDTIVKFMLSKDKTISEQELEDIRTFAQFSHGKNLALYFISFQQRSEKQVKDYLIKHDIDADIIPDVINNLIEDKWIDDSKYVEAYIRQNHLNGDKGPLVLKQKLLQKGIAQHDIDLQLEQADFSELAEKIGAKIHDKYLGKLPPKALKDKITQGLLTKGFSYDLAKRVTNPMSFEMATDDNDDLLDHEFDKQYRKYSRNHDGYTLKQKLYQALYRKGYGSDEINRKLRDSL